MKRGGKHSCLIIMASGVLNISSVKQFRYDMGWEINICCCPILGCRAYFIILKKQKGFDKGILLICSQIDQTIDHNHYEAVMQQKQDMPRIPLFKSPWQYTYGQIGLINQGWVHVTVRKVNTLFLLMIENKSTQGGTSLELNQPTRFYLFRILKTLKQDLVNKFCLLYVNFRSHHNSKSCLLKQAKLC